MSLGVETTSSLTQYVRQRRIESESFLDIVKEIRACHKKRSTKVIVVHESFPFICEDELDESKGDQAPRAYPASRTDLVRLLAEHFESDPAYHVFSFFDGRQTWADEPRFYQEQFFPLISKAFSKRRNSIRARVVHVTGVLWNRACILVSVAGPLVFSAVSAVFAVVSAVFSLKVVDFLQKPENIGLLAAVMKAVRDFNILNPTTSLELGFGSFVVFLMLSWGKVLTMKDAWERWKSQKLFEDSREIENGLQDRLMQFPEQLLDRLSDHKRTLVFFIDDAECMDAKSLEFLLDLSGAAKAKRVRLVMLLAVDPKNPILRRPDRLFARHQFESRELERKEHEGWGVFEVLPLTASQAKAWLWGYYSDIRTERIYSALTGSFDDSETDPETILSFFCSLDGDCKADEARNAPLSLESNEIRRRFQKHLGRHEDISRRALSALMAQPNEKQCIQLLKFTLCFRTPQVRIGRLAEVMAISDTDLNACLETLVSRTGLLVRHGNDLAFAHTHFRGFLQRAWSEWRNEKRNYATLILNASRNWGVEENADVALDAEPSQFAIDVLWRRGEYAFNFYGASDAGYALRYYGLKDGALGKWRRLFARMENEEDIWDLLSWKSEARLDPYKRSAALRLPKSPMFPSYLFIPDLFLTTARLYWMIGDDDIALEILTEWWPEAMEKIGLADARGKAKANLRARVLERNQYIEAAVNEIRFRRGSAGDWDKAKAIGSRYKNSSARRDLGTENAMIFSALIQHYRKVGLGNKLEGLHFLDSESAVTSITSVLHCVRIDNLERCRLLWALAESYSEMLRFPSLKISIRISWEDVKHAALDESILNSLDVILGELRKTLEKFSRDLNKSPSTQFCIRLSEANLLFWEGLYIVGRGRQFCFEALRAVPKENSGTKRSTPGEKVCDIYKLVRRLADFCVRCLPTKAVPEELDQEIARITRIQASLEQHDQSQAQEQARKLLPLICEAGVVGMAALAKERLHMAEAIYRRLCFMRGIREVTYNRAMLDRWLSSEGIATERVRWIEDIKYASASSPELGAHLDALYACVTEAEWASDHDLNRAGQSMRRGAEWADRLGLPAAQRVFLAIQATHHLAMAEGSPVSLQEIIEVAEEARQLFDSLDGATGFSSESAMTSKWLSLHWWLARLYWDKSHVDGDAKRFLAKAHAEVESIIGKAQGTDFKLELHSAFHLRGAIFEKADECDRAYEDYETALKYFQQTGSNNQAIQVANALLRLINSKLSDRDWRGYFVTLRSLACQMLEAKKSLKGSDWLQLSRGCSTIANVYDINEKVDQALGWYEKAFEALLRINLPGKAILLDQRLRPLYLRLLPASASKFAEHKARVLSVSPTLDPSTEQLDFGSIGQIIRCYAQSSDTTGPKFKDKKDFLDTGNAALTDPIPKMEAAIAALERAAELMTESSPEYIDLEILKSLRIAYLRNGDVENAEGAERLFNQRHDLIESRDFIEVADYYKTNGWDYIWALEIAIHVKIPNEFSRRALELLIGLG